ncbi:hypothetical protein B0E53_04297 [Micromonospora sp. MH33]|nr:hypothetical protein B0E53_04297 [Micromonospora sp. MH33]
MALRSSARAARLSDSRRRCSAAARSSACRANSRVVRMTRPSSSGRPTSTVRPKTPESSRRTGSPIESVRSTAASSPAASQMVRGLPAHMVSSSSAQLAPTWLIVVSSTSGKATASSAACATRFTSGRR